MKIKEIIQELFTQSGRDVILYKLALPFIKAGIHPNFVTFLAFLTNVLCGLFICLSKFWLAGIFLLLAFPLDGIDGVVARATGKTSLFGAFLDSVLDRYGEFFIYFGALLYYRDKLWILILIFFALLGSYMVSYTRARAEGLGQECKVGFTQRGVRIFLLMIGLFCGQKIFPYFVALIAFLSNWTALYRFFYVKNKLRRRDNA